MVEFIDIGLKGKWTNQLGSKMEITNTDSKGFSGVYYTSVGNAIEENDLIGSYIIGNNGCILLAFHVCWRKRLEGSDESLTSWTGKYHRGDKIKTTWVLVKNDNSTKDWSSYLTNQDEFTKTD